MVVTVAGYAKDGLVERKLKPGSDANPLHEGCCL